MANQAKTLIRNHNHHFTQMQNKQIINADAIKELRLKTELLPIITEKVQEMYLYLNKFHPMSLLETFYEV